MEEIIERIETGLSQSQNFQDYFPKGDFLQDITILQNENKMKAALGKNVKVSLPKTFQTKKDEPKNLALTGVPTDITDNEFKEFLDLIKLRLNP